MHYLWSKISLWSTEKWNHFDFNQFKTLFFASWKINVHQGFFSYRPDLDQIVPAINQSWSARWSSWIASYRPAFLWPDWVPTILTNQVDCLACYRESHVPIIRFAKKKYICESLKYPCFFFRKVSTFLKSYLVYNSLVLVLIFKKWFWVNIEPYLVVVFSNYRFFVTPFARSSAENCRGYTKAPKGRRDKATFRGSSDDQDDQRPTGFDRLLFLNMFENSSRSLFWYPILVGLRRLRQTSPDLPRWLSVIVRKFPIVSQICGRST